MVFCVLPGRAPYGMAQGSFEFGVVILLFQQLINPQGLSDDFALGKIDDGPLSLMVSRYFEDGYARFDQLCRSIYAEVIPKWEAALIPWDQIVADRSHSWQVTSNSAPATPACGDCSTMAAGFDNISR